MAGWKPKDLQEALEDAVGSALNDNAYADGIGDYIRAEGFDKVIKDIIQNIKDIKGLIMDWKG